MEWEERIGRARITRYRIYHRTGRFQWTYGYTIHLDGKRYEHNQVSEARRIAKKLQSTD